MIDICVFGKYKVKLHNKYSYISDYDYEMKDPIFSEHVEEWEKVMDGGELMHLVANLMLENDAITFECKTSSIEHGKPVGEIVIEKFEPQDGTGGTITIKYEQEGKLC